MQIVYLRSNGPYIYRETCLEREKVSPLVVEVVVVCRLVVVGLYAPLGARVVLQAGGIGGPGNREGIKRI